MNGLIETIFQKIGAGFTPEAYMAATRIQGILWGISDCIFIYFLLKVVGHMNSVSNRKKVFFRYGFLFISAILIPFLVFTKNSGQLFMLESVIFVFQLSVLLYTAFADAKRMMVYLRGRVVGGIESSGNSAVAGKAAGNRE